MKRTLFCLLMGVFLTLSVSVPVLAQPSYDFTLLSSSLISSSMTGMAYLSPTTDTVFICTKYGVASYDVTDPANPILLDVVATDGIAYSAETTTINSVDYLVVADASGFAIINIDNPGDLVQVGYYGIAGNCRSLDVEGNLVYLVGEMSPGGISIGLKVFDLIDPANPINIGNYIPFPGVYYDVKVVDTLAFVAAGAAGVQVLGVGTPTAPYFITQSSPPGGSTARKLLVNPTLQRVAVADLNNVGLYIYDYSTLAYPLPVATVASVLNPAYYLTAYNDTLYVLEDNGSTGLMQRVTWTGSTPAGTFTPAAFAVSEVVRDGCLWFFEEISGVQVLNLNPPGPPIYSYMEYGGPRAAIKIGNYAYVANYTAGVVVLDMGDFSAVPELMAEIPTGLNCYDVDQWGDYVYAVDFNGNLVILDVTTPGSPDSVNTVALPAGTRAGAIHNGYLYIATYFDGVQILNLNANPTNPTVGGTIALTDTCKGVTAANGVLYVAATTAGVRAYSLATPLAPTFIADYNDGFMQARQIAVEGNVVAVAAETELVVLNFDGATFTELNTMGFTSDARGVTLDGNIMYVAEWEYGIDAYDITDPDTAVYYGDVLTPGQAYEVVLWDDDHILVCDSYSLLVYEQTVTGVKPWTNPNAQPSGFSLIGNYPNPFNPTTTIAFNLQVGGLVTINIFDMMGRQVANAFSGELPAGEHHLQYHGGNLASGTYIVQVSSPWGEASSQMVLLK